MDQRDARAEMDRRTVLRRAAVVGGAMVWTTPVVQSIGGAAFAATGSPAPDAGTPEPDAGGTVLTAGPAGTTSLACYVWDGHYDATNLQHGYGTWVGSWVRVSGAGAAITSGDAGGFYWAAEPSVAVSHVVIKGVDDEVVTLGPVNPVSQNALVNRSGIWEVRFCG